MDKGKKRSKKIEEEIKKTWDKHGKVGYEHFVKMKVMKGYMAALGKMLLPCPGGTVFDGGCGVGHNFKQILEKTKAKKLIGGDYSEEMLKKARKLLEKMDSSFKDRIELVEVDLTKRFPFKDNMFDAVVYSISLNYLPYYQWKDTLEETFRTLKPEGFMYFVGQTREFDFSKGYKKEVFREMKEKLLKGDIPFIIWLFRVKGVVAKINEFSKKGIIIYPTINELKECLKELGFVNIEVIAQPNAKEHKGAGTAIRAQKPRIS